MKMKQKLRSRLLAICTALICGCVMLLSGGVIDIESYAATDTGEVCHLHTRHAFSYGRGSGIERRQGGGSWRLR